MEASVFCESPRLGALAVGISSVILLATTLFEASFMHGLPLKYLGVRPKGRGLFSFLYHYYADGVGVIGYDPILGSMSPPLRVLIHLAAIGMLWSTSLLLSGWFTPVGDIACSGRFLVTWVGSACAYLLGMFYLHWMLPGVSVPGGPRPHKIQRQPAWKDESTTLPKRDSDKDLKESVQRWKMVCGRASHDATLHVNESVQRKMGEKQPLLTGEPSGRDIWTCDAGKQPSLHYKREEMIQKMASGGRPWLSFNPQKNPNGCDMLLRAQQIRAYIKEGNDPPPTTKSPSTLDESLRRAVHFYSMLQCEDGHWSGDYGGPHFLMPGLVVVWYAMDRPESMLDAETRSLMRHYILVHQQVDGGWGTHIESPSTMFGTTLMYVALRLLGLPAEHEACQRGRSFILEQGGAVMTSSWAKFYLCLLGCMEWDGHNSVPPEMWMLPLWFPFHPARMWCHARMVYLPMGYLYGSRFVYKNASTDPLILSLRKEMYKEDYDSIPWIRTLHCVADMDNYSPIPTVMKLAQIVLACYETWSIFQPFKNWARSHGLRFSAEYMMAEDKQTNWIDIGPVNKVLNMLSRYAEVDGDLDDPFVRRHIARVPDYLWLAEDGIKMQGYNGSQCWDTSFAIQAIYEADLLEEFPVATRRAWKYLERCQILSTDVSRATDAYGFESAENRAKCFRHVSEGGWPFSTSAHGWPISDCSGEGLKGVLCLRKSPTVQEGLKDGTLKEIDEVRLQKCVHLLLTYQNEDGGFATYENNRGFLWYESLNPSECFGDIMIDYSYVECSMASLTALVEFRADFPDHRADEVSHAIDKGREFLKSLQRVDGSWYGSWACCFCYACWFGIEGLVKCGEPTTSDAISRGCGFLLRQQRPNGGWGEDFTSCYDKSYAADGMSAYGGDGSGVVNTGWALLALSAARHGDVRAVARGVRFLLRRQLPWGDFPQEGIAGVFNRACGITYTAYRNVFPIWALGRCRAAYGTALEDALRDLEREEANAT